MDRLCSHKQAGRSLLQSGYHFGCAAAQTVLTIWRRVRRRFGYDDENGERKRNGSKRGSLHRWRRRLRFREIGWSHWRSQRAGHRCRILRGRCEPVLEAARQFVLAFRRDESVFASHLKAVMASNLRRFDGATTDLLPPRDVRPTEGMRPQPWKIASLSLPGLVEGIAAARIPKRLSRRALLLENVRLRYRAVLDSLHFEPGNQIADTQDAAAVLALWTVDILVPDALLNLDCAGVEVYVLPLQPEHFRDARASGDTRLNDQQVRFFQVSQHARGLLEGEDPALSLVPFLAEPRLADRTAPALLPQAMTLGIVEDTAHDGANAVHRPPRVESGVQPVFDRLRG